MESSSSYSSACSEWASEGVGDDIAGVPRLLPFLSVGLAPSVLRFLVGPRFLVEVAVPFLFLVGAGRFLTLVAFGDMSSVEGMAKRILVVEIVCARRVRF